MEKDCTVRESTQRMEETLFSPHACLSAQSRGRETPEEECPYRTCFQRDRDRVLHCKSFRRLMHKTQVFLLPEGDHYRTRLTHTLEVAQIARTVARGLRLNEDLTEAIALGHDLGHTPFGHAGEEVLNALCLEEGGFVHSAQSVRVVEQLENDGRGLNLCFEVRDGIRCHSKGEVACTLEGQVVRYADKIAYMNHDIEDAIRARVLEPGDIPWDLQYVLGRNKSARISTMVSALIEHSEDDICMDTPIQKAYEALRRFMFEAVYTNPVAKGEENKAKDVVKGLFAHFMQHPDKLPGEFHQICAREGASRAVRDYISCMSDRYAVNLFVELFVPRAWNV